MFDDFLTKKNNKKKNKSLFIGIDKQHTIPFSTLRAHHTQQDNNNNQTNLKSP